MQTDTVGSISKGLPGGCECDHYDEPGQASAGPATSSAADIHSALVTQLAGLCTRVQPERELTRL